MRLRHVGRSMPTVAKHQKALMDAVYAVDGIIVINGIDGKAISSPDPDQPVRVRGSELAKHGLDLVDLIRREMILPTTNQELVEQALQFFEDGGKSNANRKGVIKRSRRTHNRFRRVNG